MQEKQRLLVGALNGSFAYSSYRSLEVAIPPQKNLKIRCYEIKSYNQLHVNQFADLSHKFVILLSNIASYIIKEDWDFLPPLV